MTKVVTIAYNAINAKIHKPSVDVKLIVQEALSYKVDGVETSIAYKQNRWTGRSSLFAYNTGSFPAGFVHFVSAHLKRAGYEVRLLRAKALPEPLGPENPVVDSFPEDPRYDYQMETVRRLTKHGQIIMQGATGCGKSRIARLAFARINRPTLFLTTRSILMYQMKDTFEKDLGIGCSVLGDGQFGSVNAAGQTTVKKMCVGMVQTLYAKLEEPSFEKEFQKLYDATQKQFDAEITALKARLTKKKALPEQVSLEVAKLVKRHNTLMQRAAAGMKETAENKVREKEIDRQKTINLLKMFEFVILEEAHEASGNSYYEILRHCSNAHYRLALTGTPFMKDSEESNMRLMACSGPIAIKVSEKMLIDRGILAKPYFKIIQLKKQPVKLLRGTAWQSAYRLGITTNEERNEEIVNEIKTALTYGLTSMILVQHTAHGDTVLKLLEDASIRADFIRGENDQDERKRALQRLSNGEIDALIGTTILDVGVDVPAVGVIILAGGGKAEVALRQRIGRGLRAKKLGPNVAFVIDFSDHWNNHTKAHALQRLDIIKGTEGFGENIVSKFDYEALGFTSNQSHISTVSNSSAQTAAT
ncbi:DEAD/DEAH box helicase [Acinetobacter brisouii]|uniref:DEAD/DEAH box helicase n=1 Tax=Acinetobacter brisouii TaxID=396323 RepID=UPI00124BDE1D|nr:DEAD/DEAH box helicase [Acinetobacter brisouii]